VVRRRVGLGDQLSGRRREPVPAGAVCKVAITRGSTPVKGSTTPYSVG
jgi:hypothetical protein